MLVFFFFLFLALVLALDPSVNLRLHFYQKFIYENVFRGQTTHDVTVMKDDAVLVLKLALVVLEVLQWSKVMRVLHFEPG